MSQHKEFLSIEQSQRLIAEECDRLKELLLSKNRNYGNSALAPKRLLSTASPVEGILIRIDDKLNRLIQGDAADEDVELDLTGYLILLMVARRLERFPQDGFDPDTPDSVKNETLSRFGRGC